MTYPPNVIINADPEMILAGGVSTLSWNSINVYSCVIEPYIGSVNAIGSITVSPDETTTYTITANGPGGTSSKNVTVTVIAAAPTEFKLTAGDTSEDDYFGSSVSISGDYAIVGAYGDDDGGSFSGSAYIFMHDGSAWIEQAKLTAGDAAADDYFGSSVSISGDYAIVGANGDDDAGDDSGSAYIFKREGTIWTEQAKLTAGDAATGDLFGYSLSISGDYAIVGANGDDDAGDDSGSAYIFKREGSSWTEQSKLTAGDAAADDYFGASVFISGDYAIVGVWGNDDDGSFSGSAYIFMHDGSAWIEQAKLTAGDAAADDYFGFSVSISGDYAIVGAYGDDDTGDGSGSAYIFKHDGSAWSEQAKLTAGDAAAGDAFGYSVSIIGDYTIVGRGGSAYIFWREDSTWTEQYKLVASDAATDDSFGYSVDIDEGLAIVSGSAYVYAFPYVNLTLSADPEIILVGEESILTWSSSNIAFCVIEPGIGAVDANGSITVSPSGTTTYTATGTGPIGSATADVTVYVIDPTASPTVEFHTDSETIYAGESCLLSWTSTNADTVIIDQGIGSVSLYGALNVSPGQSTKYTITASGPGGVATSSVTVTVTYPPPTVSISADPGSIQIGGASTLTWSSINVDSVVIDQGIGSVDPNGSITVSPTETTTYTITATGPGGTASADVTVAVIPHEIKLTAGDAAAGDKFGYSVSISGEYAIVGAPDSGIHNDDDEGSAYIFIRDGFTWTEQAKLMASDAGTGSSFGYADRFGNSVSISGDYAIVGDHGDDHGLTDSGSAYIFKRDGSAWIEQAKLRAGDAAIFDHFGISVSISGDYAIVGAYGDDDGGSYSGSAYIFKRDGSSWTEQAKLTAGDAAAWDHFGCSVSISGDYAIVGAYCDDDGGDNSGSAYIFKRDGSIWTEQAKLTAGDTSEDDYFGSSVSISGDYAIVGAEYDTDVASSSGSAYIFKRDGSAWTQQAKLRAGDAARDDYFGVSVSISGDYAIAGAWGNDDAGDYSGSAYIFKRDGSIWTEQAKLRAGDAAAYDFFGRAVSISGNFAIVGAYSNDDSGLTSGSAYLYPIDLSVTNVNISADPVTILAGESSTLSWISINADSCVIEPDIGIVAVNGSTTVSPTETTTYTITATGPDGTATDSITVTVNYPPTAIISADPETILAGESSTLTWSSTNADSCLIEPDIGNVNMSGSITVTPNETTIYTITATGPGGAVSDNVTVIVISLTVSISADPESILVGGSSVLTWSSTNADSVTIDQGIGSVDTIGSIPVSPDETTTYNITATGLGYTATASVTVTVTPIAISITSPLDGETITGPDTIVYGTITNLTGNETGVYVNGIVAMVYENQFVANHVLLQEGENTITATATDTDGNTATTSITINAVTTEHYIRITAETDSGVSPLETTLKVDGSFSFTESSISYTGPGVVEFLDSANENEYNVRMTTPGIYFFTAEVTDDQSNTYTDTVAVQVLDEAVLDALLKAKWNEMKLKLIGGDIDGALEYFIDGRSRQRYNEIFNLIEANVPGGVSADAQNLPEPILIEIKGSFATYILAREEEGTMIEYNLYFVKDDSGLWRIYEY